MESIFNLFNSVHEETHEIQISIAREIITQSSKIKL